MKRITLDELDEMTGGKRLSLIGQQQEEEQQDQPAATGQPRRTTLSEVRQRATDRRIQEDQPVLDTGDSLRKSDLMQGQRAADIRAYMIDRFGVDYEQGQGKSDEDMVNDFVDHMRYFNSNVVSTAGEARYIQTSDDVRRQRAAAAYGHYDQLGNVFTNDGFWGAVDGVKDYVLSAALDPTNYVGLITAGWGKAAGLGLGAGGKAAVRTAATAAARTAARDLGTQGAARMAGGEAARRAGRSLLDNGIRGTAARGLRVEAARREYQTFMREASLRAARGVFDEAGKRVARQALINTTAIDASFAMLQDVTLQGTLIEAGAQENYSAVQTGFSSLLGAVGGLAQLGMGKFGAKSGLDGADVSLRIAAERTANKEAIEAGITELSEKQRIADFSVPADVAKEAASHVADAIKRWKISGDATQWSAKLARGKDQFDAGSLPVLMLKDILLGADGKGGLAKFMRDRGHPLPKGIHVSDIMTTVVRELPQEELKNINDLLKPMGITLGETTEMAQNLGDLLAVEISKGGQVLNVVSQMRKQIDGSLVHGHQIIDAHKAAIDNLEAEAAKQGRMKLGQYGQSVWRRMLVSSPQTTAVNVLGYGQFAMGQNLADLFSGTASTLYGLARGGNMTKAGREALRVGKVYRAMQVQKMRNLLDPFTTHDAYMEFLKQHSDVEQILFESFTGGVERSAKRYGIDPKAPWFQRLEAMADGANRLTGVKVQDSFTKSQMFMGELDKWLRLDKDMDLATVLKSGDLTVIDNDVIGKALDTTLKSVFSKNYTTDDQLLSAVAKQVENFSNIPLIGTVLPFGRFFNNTIATAYQWSVGGGVEVMSAIVKAEKRNLTTLEAASRSIVGMTSLRLAMEYDEKRREQGLAYNEIDVGGGNIVDARNQFPFSLWLAVGRAGNLARQGEMVPKELIEDITAQLAVGQFAKDIQFGNDLYNVFDTLLNQEDGARKMSFDAVYKQGGSIIAGFTRPLDAVNRMVGLINNSDAAKDARQATGVDQLTIQSTRYIDNIIEIFTDKLDGVTGEELRLATREGPIQDANPVMRLLGITVKPARTATEKAYSMAELHSWTAGERSQLPAYDAIFNETIAPMFEENYKNLINTPEYQNGSVAERRTMLNAFKTDITGRMREYLRTGVDDSDTRILALRRKASTYGSREARKEAMDYLREEYGVTGGPTEFNHEELMLYFDAIDYFKDQTLTPN